MINAKTAPWIVLVLICVLHLAITEKLRCYKGSFENYKEVDIKTPETLVNSSDPYIDSSKPTIIFIHGWNGNPYGFAVSTLITTLVKLKKFNVCLVNWKRKASGELLGPLLGYFPVVVPASKTVGENLGRAILKLIALGVSKAFHLIGHSVGAHIAGYAGRETKSNGTTLPWISSLDGAGPGFEDSEYKPVDASCATFVDWIHCDPGFFGLNKSLGHVDFWPNYGAFTGGDMLQPGCSALSSPLDFVVQGNFCNHNRCIELYNASLTHPMILVGSKAPNYTVWVNTEGDTNDTNYIGLAVIKTKQGNYYMNTSGEYPYGKGAEGY